MVVFVFDFFYCVWHCTGSPRRVPGAWLRSQFSTFKQASEKKHNPEKENTMKYRAAVINTLAGNKRPSNGELASNALSILSDDGEKYQKEPQRVQAVLDMLNCDISEIDIAKIIKATLLAYPEQRAKVIYWGNALTQHGREKDVELRFGFLVGFVSGFGLLSELKNSDLLTSTSRVEIPTMLGEFISKTIKGAGLKPSLPDSLKSELSQGLSLFVENFCCRSLFEAVFEAVNKEKDPLDEQKGLAEFIFEFLVKAMRLMPPRDMIRIMILGGFERDLKEAMVDALDWVHNQQQ